MSYDEGYWAEQDKLDAERRARDGSGGEAGPTKEDGTHAQPGPASERDAPQTPSLGEHPELSDSKKED